jgi:signal transduction histidine kinase/ligand-binding sensor domain-containing protein/DNA-binding response OmpR family regulator
MPGRNTFILIIVIFFFSSHQSPAQEREYIYDHFNISNGLISDNVYKIFIDGEGYTWIITYNGLQKYNGYKFESYTSKPGVPGSLSSNFVVDILEDRKNDLIVVLEDGIDIYHKQTNRFTNLVSNLPFAEAKRNEISRQASVVQDKSGFVWANCNNHLVRIDSTMENFLLYQNEFNGNFVLNRDSSLLWIITDNTLKKYDLDTRVLTITNIADIPAPVPVGRLNVIFYDSENICWLGTSNGLFMYDEKKSCFTDPGFHFPNQSLSKRNKFEENITAIYEDYQKDLWIASGKLLYRIGRKSGNIQILQHETDNPNTILDGQITGIFGNNSGTIWITYLNEGFTRINIKTRDFRSYRFKVNRNDGLGGNSVRSVFRDQKGYIWVGLYNSGLDRIDPKSGFISHFRHNDENEKTVYSNYISSLYVDENQRLWVGSHDNGLCYADDVYSDNLTFKRPSFLNSNDEVYHILADKLGRVWFGTRTGLGMYDYKDESFHWILQNHNIQSFIIDQQTIWIASWNYGLCQLNFSPEEFSASVPAYDTVSSVFSGITKSEANDIYEGNPGTLNRCISIYQDPLSDIWLGTYDKGLVRVGKTGYGFTYKFYDISQGAPGSAVYGVTGDQKGNIWISTDQGIGKFDPLTEKFENYYRQDGLLSNYFMWKAYYKSPDGELFFGSVDGLNCFYPDEIYNDTVRLRVLISELRVQNQLVECGDTVNGDIVLNRQIIYQDTLVLSHLNSNFSFDFFATGTMNPERITYAHMLAGFDEGWVIHSEGNRNASYSNLSPGTYLFRVKATENDGLWQNKYAEKVVVILPPWWKTKLAFAVYIMLILGLMFLISQSLIRFLGLKHDLIYNEKLHQSKLSFFTNISHEFKTPLSLIKAPLNEILLDKKLSPHNRKNLNIARQNADNLLNLVNELMEFRRTDAGISNLQSENIDLTEFVNEITAQFESIAEQKNIHFITNIPDEKLKIWVDREKFRKIINNLLANAFNYTPKGGIVTFSIVKNPGKFTFNSKYHTLHLSQIRKDLEYIGILVSDSGVGISSESLPKIFDRFYQVDAEIANDHIGSGIGLALVKNLVLLHYGDLQVASERREGTEILVSLPLGDKHLSKVEKMPDVHQSSFIEPSATEDKATGAGPLHGNDSTRNNNSLPIIMIVEDHRELRSYLKDNFSDEYIIHEVSNGAEGIKKLNQIRPDLIITDWIMPVMDGGKFLREIKSIKGTSSIPVILLTARNELKDKQEALDLGADQIITKPFNLQLLKAQVKRMIENNRSRMQKYGIENSENLVNVQNNLNSLFIEKVEGVINKHIKDTNLNAAFIANELALSRTALYTRTREITGWTIGEYIQKIRLKHAIKLMLYENRSVSEVYTMVGISSSSYFIRLFKKYYHTTPKEYIRNSLNKPSN